MPAPELPTLVFQSPEAWREWLGAHHASSAGVWIKFARKNSGILSINYAQALEEALCYGWIDGQVKSIDEQFYQQRFVPRRRGGLWSLVNRGKALALIANGKMQAAGLAVIEHAQANGRWDAAYPSPSKAAVPADLASALEASPIAGAFFATLNGRNRYAILFALHTARKPQTRAARLAKFIGMLERGEKVH